MDQVFTDPAALAGIRPAEEGRILAIPLKHDARRAEGGCVELWPLEVTDQTVEVDPWEPVDAEPAESANKKLARRIAISIKAMVARGDAVGDRDLRRACVYRDVLILVRRRNALFHEIIRALKREGVAVGGADRLLLSDHGVFEDLMALAKFACFPADDLTLAALLRSPFSDISEESLFDLAWRREGSLWATLRRRAAERPDWLAAEAFLAWVRGEAKRRPPFDLYSRLLSRLDGEGRSMRQRILTRLGAEAEDAVDAFLAEALAAEGRNVRDLETFIARMADNEIEVKREQEDIESRPGGEVRVMTVHGAKGLEAPIVILPDTTTRATAQGGPLLDAEDKGFLWAPRKADDCPASSKAREARERASEEESLRLLYVALTRARDRLIVCGVDVQKARMERSWRDYVQRAFDFVDSHPFALDGGGEGVRHGPDPVAASAGVPDAALQEAPPAWVRTLAAPDSGADRIASPSSLGEDDHVGAPSPLAVVGGLGRFRRGDIIHHLLQILPDVPIAERETAGRKLLAREVDLSAEQRREMLDAALGVLADDRFAAVFGPGSKPEVALAGAAARLPKGVAISGRVDRLLVEPGRVLVIDFKTNRPSPDRIEDASRAYIVQMAVYAAVLSEIFPGRPIEAALIWTDGPKLMPVPEKLMLKALDEITANG